MEYPDPSGMRGECQKKKGNVYIRILTVPLNKEGSQSGDMCRPSGLQGGSEYCFLWTKTLCTAQVANSDRSWRTHWTSLSLTHPQKLHVISALHFCPLFTGKKQAPCSISPHWSRLLIHLVSFYFFMNLYFGRGEASIVGCVGD